MTVDDISSNLRFSFVQSKGIMWHLRTKLGTFWVVEAPQGDQEQYYLGIDNYELGKYQNKEEAVQDVCQQNTGYFDWDCLTKVKVPGKISQWKEGEPRDWMN